MAIRCAKLIVGTGINGNADAVGATLSVTSVGLPVTPSTAGSYFKKPPKTYLIRKSTPVVTEQTQCVFLLKDCYFFRDSLNVEDEVGDTSSVGEESKKVKKVSLLETLRS